MYLKNLRYVGLLQRSRHVLIPLIVSKGPLAFLSCTSRSSIRFYSEKKLVNISGPETPKKNLWTKVKHEAQHYWDGTKLLGMEVRISSKLLLKMATGYELTRREFKQLTRTTTDIMRLFPFAMFIIVPFAELLLPVALKIFPNLLPSTYESKLDKEKKAKLLRKTRTKVSEVLRNAKSSIKLPSNVTEEEKTLFKEFYQAVKSGSNEQISREQLIRVARMFKDDLVLDNLSRPLLVAISKYINLKPFGTDQILRYRIRHKMLNIKKDDKVISYEGVDSLTAQELQVACASRGFKVHTVPSEELRNSLSLWLKMRLEDKIPSTLLILSCAYDYGNVATTNENLYENLQAILGSLPEEIYHVTELDVDDDTVTHKQRLNVLKEQEHLIKSEVNQEKDHIVLVRDGLSLDDADEPVKQQPKKDDKT
ncbi:BA75_04475T0 [Komagataella pastoris]|uniref:BA75_04475T0 n=1 Tax=Komagataella pastoris TaxID=4922 RepID=A0A1B2JH84_PICPA|nr:BA75_04475T0 [Komagataella pastoris]